MYADLTRSQHAKKPGNKFAIEVIDNAEVIGKIPTCGHPVADEMNLTYPREL